MLKSANYYRKKAPPQMFKRVLNMPLFSEIFKDSCWTLLLGVSYIYGAYANTYALNFWQNFNDNKVEISSLMITSLQEVGFRSLWMILCSSWQMYEKPLRKTLRWFISILF